MPEELDTEGKEIEAFRTKGAAGYLKISTKKLLRKARAGDIPYAVVRGKYYFNSKDLDRYARGKMPKPDLKAQEAERKRLEEADRLADKAIAIAEKEGRLLKFDQIQGREVALIKQEGELKDRKKSLDKEADDYLDEITAGLLDWTEQLDKRVKEEFGGDYKERQKELSSKLMAADIRMMKYNALIGKYKRGARTLLAISHCLPTEYYNRIADALDRNLEQGEYAPIDVRGCQSED